MYDPLISPLPLTRVSWLALLVVGLPLLSFIFQLASQKGRAALALGMMSLSFLVSLGLCWMVSTSGTDHFRVLWLSLPGSDFSPAVEFTFGFRTDLLAAVMAALVTGISALVHVFSWAYMEGEKFLNRYWAYLGLFTAAMLLIVLADNLLWIFVGWELVGLSSYLLIGFWFQQDRPARAAQKAFLTNRVGDVALLSSLLIFFAQLGTLDLEMMGQALAASRIEEGNWGLTWGETGPLRQLSSEWLTAAGVLFFLGCGAKSAQLPFQTWLPDAMEGPTPVSALIHAATMVAAGVYLLARFFPMLTPEVLSFVAWVGAITALMAGVAACVQWDIKRVLAYSTISQLGFMMVGLGTGAYDMALLHLFTHAFFKAGLFLVAGAVIHQLHHVQHDQPNLTEDIPAAQDLRLMGGLYDQMPRLAWLYLPMMLALAGLPLFSGFLSKEGILEGAMQYGSHYEGVAWMVPVMALFSAGLTAFYMARHALLIFAGKPRFQTQVSLSPLPRTMLLPLAILSLGSIWLIWSLNPFSATQSPWLQFWPTPAFMLPQGVVSFEAAPYSQPGILLGLSLLLALGGMALGYFWWKRKEAQLRELPAQPHWAYQHFFQDFLYEMGVGKGSLRFSQLLGWIDKYVVDGLVRTLSWLTVHEHRNFASLSLLSAKWDERVFDGLVRWIAGTLGRVGRMFMRLQNGEIQAYWAMALFGILGLTGWMFWMIMN